MKSSVLGIIISLAFAACGETYECPKESMLPAFTVMSDEL
jgi:hypothetical protein